MILASGYWQEWVAMIHAFLPAASRQRPVA